MFEPVLLKLKGSALAVNLDLGFIPQKVRITELHATTPMFFEWFGEMMEDGTDVTYEASVSENGIDIDGAGVTTVITTESSGIKAYDGAKTPQVLLEDPSTGKLTKTDIYGNYDITADYDSVGTARSATVIGTVVRPTTHNGYVYELITKSASASGAEPTWGTVPGETTTDASDNIWMCREENLVANKGLGITIGASVVTTDAIYYVEAYRFQRCEDLS